MTVLRLLPWLLFTISLLFTGASAEGSTVYSRVGDTASLPCKPDGDFNCSSALWGYYFKPGFKPTELVSDGKVKDENQKESGKLSVAPNCTLYINSLTTADAGLYYCQAYLKGKNVITAPPIDLTLLKVSASSAVTELKVGSTVTLHCELHGYKPCPKQSIRVTWVTETGAPLQGERYSMSESQCSSNLTVTLQHSDRNMKWRCDVTEEGKLKASHSYTTIFHSPPDENMRNDWIISGAAICVAFFLIVILIMICKKRRVQRQRAFNPVSESNTVTDQNKTQSEDSVTYATVNPSGKRKQHRETAQSETEYATIKTSHRTQETTN